MQADRHGDGNSDSAPTGSSLQKWNKILLFKKKSAEPPLHGEVFKTCKKINGMMANMHIYMNGTMTDMHIYMNGTMADMHKIISNHIYITMSQPLLRLPPLLLYHYYYRNY